MDIEDYSVDYYLDQVEKQTELSSVNELADIDNAFLVGGAVALAAGTILNAAKIAAFLVASAAFHRSIKVDPVRSKKLNQILKTNNRWIVHQFPDAAPNAFAITGNHVFITTGLVKILNEREQLGVLLHEVFHNKDLHSWKGIAARSAFTYLIVFVAATIVGLSIFPGLSILVAFILHNSLNIAYARLVGRRHEIKADEFATVHGYGLDLVSAFDKMEKWAKSKASSAPCNKFCQIERKISSAIDEHPPTKKRVEIILRKTAELNRLLKGNSFKKIAKYVSGVFKNNG